MTQNPLKHRSKYKLISKLILLALVAPTFGNAANTPTLSKKMIAADFSLAQQKIAKDLKNIPAGRFPITSNSAGKWITTKADGWTSGFFPGILWLISKYNAQSNFATAAKTRQQELTAQQNNRATHDIGFIIFDSFGNGYRLTNNPNYKQVILNAANTLALRYNPQVGLTKSWDGNPAQYQVIIDNMMNLELLFWSAKNGGGQNLYEIAKKHALKSARDFVRPDGSTYHLNIYNPKNGKLITHSTAQGYSSASAWSRGQAWAIYGFTIAYRETKETTLLTAARKTADYFINNLPADSVPVWDFRAPNKSKEPRDSSAAAIAASGLLELARQETDMTRSLNYKNAAEKILTQLSRNYLAKDLNKAGILSQGTYDRKSGNYNTATIWGDYYFLEALLKFQELNQK